MTDCVHKIKGRAMAEDFRDARQASYVAKYAGDYDRAQDLVDHAEAIMRAMVRNKNRCEEMGCDK